MRQVVLTNDQTIGGTRETIVTKVEVSCKLFDAIRQLLIFDNCRIVGVIGLIKVMNPEIEYDDIQKVCEDILSDGPLLKNWYELMWVNLMSSRGYTKEDLILRGKAVMNDYKNVYGIDADVDYVAENWMKIH